MKLWDLKMQEQGQITEIDFNHPSADRLKLFGFSPGQSAKYLHRTSLNGPRVYLLEDTIYSLSFELASIITIEKSNP